MEKLITSPTVLTKIKKACITGGTIVSFPNVKLRDFEISIDTLQTLFGECVRITQEYYMGNPCIVISNANFFITDSESMGADVVLELKDNDPL